MKPLIFGYKQFSTSVRLLSQALGCRRAFPGSVKRPRRGEYVLNWGSSQCPYPSVNAKGAVIVAGNKLLSFQAFADNKVPTPLWTTNWNVVIEWLAKKHPVVARKVLNGARGAGIVMLVPGAAGVLQITPEDELQDDTQAQVAKYPLFTRFRKFTNEYRIHVFDGQVIDMIEKRRRKGVDGQRYIRNWDNGFVFCRENVNPPEEILEASKKAVSSLGLTFGAVDVGYGANSGIITVLEVNTAPGIEGTSVVRYANAINNYKKD